MLNRKKTIVISCLLFEHFETLDLMGPVEFLAALPNVELHYISLEGGLVSSRQGFQIMTERYNKPESNAVLLLPGGQGVRKLVKDKAFLDAVSAMVEQAAQVLSVCTGAALLAKAGLLQENMATTNKRAWEWVISNNSEVKWQKHARWVVDGKFYTSSGVSAGMDMTLGFIADFWGRDVAEELALKAEYVWNDQADCDLFAQTEGIRESYPINNE